MKIFMSLVLFMFMSSAFALTRSDVERMLSSKNVSLQGLEASGSVMLLGEVTGHGRSIPLEKVQAILTDKDAILRHEIESVSPSGVKILGSSDSIRAGGQYILIEDVRATILKP